MNIGGYNREIGRFIYKSSREIINLKVRAGKIAEEDADKEWAKLVAKKLIRAGAKVPKNILDMMK